jgi:hypothetical protein
VPTIKQVTIRRIDFEPKKDFLEFRTYAHIFIQVAGGPGPGQDVDVYTDTPRFEAAFLTAFASKSVVVK